jgi:pyrrolidone-carboxylate peptidase
MVKANGPIVIGAFRPFGGKSTNNAQEVSKGLQELHQRGELGVPADADVQFLSLSTDAKSVDEFCQTAKDLDADKVLLLGESGFSTKIESQAFDRGVPGTVFGSAAREMLPSDRNAERLKSAAPIDRMASASDSKVSNDAGHFYCNYAYHQALDLGLNAAFIHVPSGLFGVGRQTEAATKQVNTALETWFIADQTA